MITPFYDKKVNCLYCEQTFTTKKVRSRFLRVKHVHSDFFQEFKDPVLNPYFYEVAVCPNCGFAFTEQFSTHLSPNIKKTIEKGLRDWKKQDFGGERDIDTAIRTLKLGLLSATLKNEKHVVIAGLCLRLAWLYRMKEDKEEEERFLNEALKQYKRSYEQADYLSTQMSDIRILYMIGELSRRVGKIKDAITYFSLVIQHENRELEKNIVNKAREQWYIIRNEK